MHSNKLCNATPFLVDWNYHGGVFIKIEPDGSIEMTDPTMIDQMRPDCPGADPIRTEMQQYGVFLRDPAVPFEVQAIEALEACIRVKDQAYKDARNHLRRTMSAVGAYNEESFAETLEQNGFAAIAKQVDVLKKRLAQYKKKVDPSLMRRTTREQYDPTRTLLWMDPPKEFESAIAMEIYLEENPTAKARQERYMAEVELQEKTERAAREAQPSKRTAKAGD